MARTSQQLIDSYLSDVEDEKFDYVEDPEYVDYINERDNWLVFIGQKQLDYDW